MKRLHVHCLTFNTFDMVSKSLERFDKLTHKYPVTTKLIKANAIGLQRAGVSDDMLRAERERFEQICAQQGVHK